MNSSNRDANFEASCGTKIVRESKFTRRMWYACGEVMDRFHNEIMPDIKAVLENADEARVDCYISVVMVGWRTATAKPKILVSCLNRDVRDDVRNSIRASHIPATYPEFGLGSSGVPLHEPLPSEPTAGKGKAKANVLDTSMGEMSQQSQHGTAVVAFHHDPSFGRKLFVAAGTNEESRSATGGVVVRIGDRYYQKTVGHFEEPSRPLAQQWSQEDLDYLSFDDDSDEDEAMHELDCDTTSRGSLTPPEEGSSQSASNDEDSEVGSSAITSGFSKLATDGGDRPRITSASPHACDGRGEVSELRHVGQLQYNSRHGNRPDLDYALVLIDGVFEMQGTNRICVNSNTSRNIEIRSVGSMPTVERDIVTVTASGGVNHGKLRPSAVYLRKAGHTSLQKLFVVQLSTVILDGDCGADVADEDTGDLYGHIVRGCRGTQIAYIVSAIDVFEDLQDRFSIVPSIESTSNIEDGSMPNDSASSGQQRGTEQREASELDEISDSLRDISISPPSRQPLIFGAFTPAPRRHQASTALSSSTRPSSTIDSASYDGSNDTGSSYATSMCYPPPVAGPVPQSDSKHTLPCEFIYYGSCNETFELADTEKWAEHIIVEHLQSQLPNGTACWFCDAYDFNARRDHTDRRTSFRNRLDHIWRHIRDDGCRADHIRADYDLIAHLWRRGLLSDKSYEAAQQWREGPQSHVTGIFPHDFIPEEIQREEPSSKVVVSEPRERSRRHRSLRKEDERRHSRK